ncbi:Flagellar basal-body rod protein FlgB [hydrothermal vent metagenome]|uniref:Flagellar basal-body rod protein FlgB n=1 Tax=hydrothermal vent metagenome TaxID=652676 RepID=A0A1W1BJ01_9ZZZZ
MGLEISRVHNLIAQALDYRAARQDMIASNIANADTPFYKPRDIRFEDALAREKAQIFQDNSSQLPLAQTNGAHLPLMEEKGTSKPEIFFRDGHMARNDGNSVDIDIETTEMSKNSVMFHALIQANKKDSMIFKSVIDASSRLQ